MFENSDVLSSDINNSKMAFNSGPSSRTTAANQISISCSWMAFWRNHLRYKRNSSTNKNLPNEILVAFCSKKWGLFRFFQGKQAAKVGISWFHHLKIKETNQYTGFFVWLVWHLRPKSQVQSSSRSKACTVHFFPTCSYEVVAFNAVVCSLSLAAHMAIVCWCWWSP